MITDPEDFFPFGDAFVAACRECDRRGEKIPAATWRTWEAVRKAQDEELAAEIVLFRLRKIRTRKERSARIAILNFLMKKQKLFNFLRHMVYSMTPEKRARLRAELKVNEQTKNAN